MTQDLITTDNEPSQQGGQMIEVATSRQAQEVQAMILLAKKFPRDEDEAIRRIQTACKRKRLAEVSMYQYARGGTSITGPSIRLAECLAQSWGNIDYGLIELSQANGESQVMAYAWDMETNTRSSKVFTAKHIRSTKQGTYALTDPRDIYEMVANQGARRVRAAILAVIPADIQELAVEQCTKTLTEGNTEPLVDRIRKMFAVFAEYGVTKEMIEKRAQRSSESFTEQNLLDLRKIYISLKDGMSKAEEWFEFSTAPTPTHDATPSKTEKAAAEMKKSKPKAKPIEVPEPPAPKMEEVAVPIELGDYWDALQQAPDEAAVRALWSEWIFDNKSTMAPELYGAGCELRDHVIRILTLQKGGDAS